MFESHKAWYWLIGSILYFAAAFVPVTASHANDEVLQSKVDSLFAQYNKPNSPGAAVGIFSRGRRVYSQGYGIADLEHGTPITPNTVFHIASVSKHFTAFAILLLVEEGKINLDDDIREYLPYVQDFGNKITIYNLIHHTSGLRDQWLLLNAGGRGFRDYLTQEQILKLVSRQRELNYAPGTDHSYSNTNYTLLAEIVSVVSGQPFRQFVNQRIFVPLGMKDSLFFDDITEVIPRRAHSYFWIGKSNGVAGDRAGRWAHEPLNYETVGATSLMTTVADMLKWAGNFSNPKVGDESLLDKFMSMGSLEDGTPIEYGFGLKRYIIGTHEAVLHTGGDAAFRSLFAYFPKEDFSVIILTNTPFDRFEQLRGIVDLYLNDGAPVSAGDLPAEVLPSAELLSALEGQYLSDSGPTLNLTRVRDRLQLRQGSADEEVVFRADHTFDRGDTDRGYTYYVWPDEAGDRSIDTITEVSAFDGSRIVHRRVAPNRRASIDVRSYVGCYVSPEFEMRYDIKVKDGILLAQSFWSREPIPFHWVERDRFESLNRGLATVLFQRNPNGEIVGFRALLRRTNRLLFQKTGDDCAMSVDWQVQREGGLK